MPTLEQRIASLERASKDSAGYLVLVRIVPEQGALIGYEVQGERFMLEPGETPEQLEARLPVHGFTVARTLHA